MPGVEFRRERLDPGADATNSGGPIGQCRRADDDFSEEVVNEAFLLFCKYQLPR
jgi:hypothetical protein